MKDLGIALTAVIIFFTGNYLSREKIKRVKTIEEFVLFIKFARTQIEFSKVPLKTIIGMAAQSKEFIYCRFLKSCYVMLCQAESFNSAWNNAVSEFFLSSSISEEEKSMIISFANALGNSDVSGQLQNCDTYISLFNEKLIVLREAAVKSSKIINTISAFAAAFIIIVFI